MQQIISRLKQRLYLPKNAFFGITYYKYVYNPIKRIGTLELYHVIEGVNHSGIAINIVNEGFHKGVKLTNNLRNSTNGGLYTSIIVCNVKPTISRLCSKEYVIDNPKEISISCIIEYRAEYKYKPLHKEHSHVELNSYDPNDLIIE